MTYAPYIISNAHYYSFWPRMIRDLRQWVHIHVFTYFITFTNFCILILLNFFFNFSITFNLWIEYILNILLSFLRSWTRSSVFLAGKFPYTFHYRKFPNTITWGFMTLYCIDKVNAYKFWAKYLQQRCAIVNKQVTLETEYTHKYQTESSVCFLFKMYRSEFCKLEQTVGWLRLPIPSKTLWQLNKRRPWVEINQCK